MYRLILHYRSRSTIKSAANKSSPLPRQKFNRGKMRILQKNRRPFNCPAQTNGNEITNNPRSVQREAKQGTGICQSHDPPRGWSGQDSLILIDEGNPRAVPEEGKKSFSGGDRISFRDDYADNELWKSRKLYQGSGRRVTRQPSRLLVVDNSAALVIISHSPRGRRPLADILNSESSFHGK